MAASQQKHWNRFAVTPRTTTDAFDQAVGDRSATQAAEQAATESVNEHNGAQTDLTEQAERLLCDVVENPFTPVSDRYEDLFASMEQGTEAKSELIGKGMVRERNVRTASLRRKLLELTSGGREYVAANTDHDTGHAGRGGIVHRFIQQTLKDLFEVAGWTAKRELFDADIYVTMAETELVVEVAMEDTAREMDHVENHFDTGFDVVWVVCRNETVHDGLQQRLAERDVSTDSVVFRTFRDIPSPENNSFADLGDFGTVE